jgi:ribosomal protein S19E (S16A)
MKGWGGGEMNRVLMQNLTQRGHLKDTDDDGRIISIHVYKLILQC